jgi:arginine/ornithine N-succinyltransferase beta subunit
MVSVSLFALSAPTRRYRTTLEHIRKHSRRLLRARTHRFLFISSDSAPNTYFGYIFLRPDREKQNQREAERNFVISVWHKNGSAN